jgi:hypothetical protein
MWEKAEGPMGTHHHAGKGKWPEMVIWEKLDDGAKKQLMMRKIDERIIKKEITITYLQYKVETLKMLKSWTEKL